MHLIIAYAASSALERSTALADLQLPRLQALLQRLQPVDTLDCPQAPHLAHEQMLARALGWPAAGPWPWAAWHCLGQQAGTAPASAASPTDPLAQQAQAWLTPCHWQVGMDQVLLLDPATLGLTDDESQALMASVQPLFEEDGLQLRWHNALHWHASGALLDDLPTVSLDRVIGQNLRHWLQAGAPGPASRTLSRLQSEVQMLLYHHPVNEAREARRQPTVNAFWPHGAGRLPATAWVTVPAIDLRLDLGRSARQGETAAWQTAWQALDASAVAELLAHVQSGGAVTLSLCSEDRAHSFATRPLSWTERLHRRVRPRRVADTLQALITP